MLSNQLPIVSLYTDGSCHTQLKIGSWVAIVFINEEKKILTGTKPNTTHQRMEILAVIEGINYVLANAGNNVFINVVSDSQYVVGLLERKERLLVKNFLTNSGTDIQNADLVKVFFSLTANLSITFTKIKAHQQKTGVPNYNIEADRLSRKLVREAVEDFRVKSQTDTTNNVNLAPSQI